MNSIYRVTKEMNEFLFGSLVIIFIVALFGFIGVLVFCTGYTHNIDEACKQLGYERYESDIQQFQGGYCVNGTTYQTIRYDGDGFFSKCDWFARHCNVTRIKYIQFGEE